MSNPLYKIYFDGVEITGFHEWNTLKYSLKRDADIGGMVSEDVATLKFTGDAYNYLKSTYDNGLCNEVEIKIWERCGGTYKLRFKGIIFVVDCKFRLTECICEVKINDDNFYSRINNNKSIPVILTSETTKNGEAITPATRLNIDMFNPTNGAHLADCEGVTVYEALRYIVEFISDGELQIMSSCFDAGGDYEGALLFTGDALYFQDQVDSNYYLPIQFGDLFDWLYKIFNVQWDIYKDGNTTYLRVEKSEFYFSDVKFNTLNSVNNLVQSSDIDKLYSKISIGNGEEYDSGVFYEDVAFFGFRREDFTILGKCNVDKAFDLQYDCITSSNAIQRQLEGGFINENNYPDSWFIINCDINTNTAVKTNWLPTVAGYFYNEQYNNNNIVIRHFGSVPSLIQYYLGSDNDKFTAFRKYSDGNITSTLANIVSNEPVQFNDDFTTPYNDINNHYGNGTTQGNNVSAANSRFTAFVSGLHTFKITFSEIICNSDGDVYGIIKRYDKTNVLIDSVNDVKNYIASPAGTYLNQEFEISLFLEIDDYVQVDIALAAGLSVDEIGGASIIFEATKLPSDFITDTFNPDEVKMIIYEFETALNKLQIDNFASDKIFRLPFNDGKQNYIGWIDSIDVDRINGKAKFKVITNKLI